MNDSAAITSKFFRALDSRRSQSEPYRHWLLREVFTDQACEAISALPFAPPRIVETEGKRETNNSTRTFFSPAWRDRFAVCRELAATLQDPETVGKLENACDITLKGGFLRIEYCQDTDGFWLEPHTDIGAKLFTMLVYLSTDPGAEGWGTDIYDQELKFVATAPYEFNCGLIFIPGADTWHGFRKRPLKGVRKLVIVNYVKDEWRSRHELAYPDRRVA